MKKVETVFDYIGQVFMIFGFSVVFLNVFCIFFGESARGMSSIFALGGEGLRVETMGQFLAEAVVVVLLKILFFTDCCIKKLALGWRVAGMFTLVIISVGVESALFGWFPVDEWLPWVMFLFSFGVCAAVSVVISLFKEKTENHKMEEALERLKKGENV